jgi:hypothetical protein
LVGGIFFTFSSFVMKALARLPSAEGIAAMQSINVVVLNPSFLGSSERPCCPSARVGSPGQAGAVPRRPSSWLGRCFTWWARSSSPGSATSP